MKILSEYSTERGRAWFCQGVKHHMVACEMVVKPGVYRMREWGRLSHEAALEKYDRICAQLDGRPYIKSKCQLPGTRMRTCRSMNCPVELGGAAYWEIFQKSCPFKSR